MKKLLIFTFLSIIILGCSSTKNETNKESEKLTNEVVASEILFQVRTSNKEDLEIFELSLIHI